MNFRTELKKPVFVVRPQLLAENARRMVKRAVDLNEAYAGRSNDVVIKIAEAKELPRGDLVKIAETNSAELKDLVVARLQSDPTETFEFVDGNKYTAAQAAEEVIRESRMGQYFLELEKETIAVVQAAFLEGQI